MGNHPYLKDKKVRIIPAPSNGRWKGIIAPEQEESMKDKAFLLPDTVRNYVKRHKHGQILDDTKEFKCPDEGNRSLTEKAYFEKVLRLNLNPYDPDNHWDFPFSSENGVSNYRPTDVIISGGELELNLNNPSDMLKYKILLTWPEEIAASRKIYNAERRPTTLFIIEDDTDENTNALEYAEYQAKAGSIYINSKDSKDAMLKIMTVMGLNYQFKSSKEALGNMFADLYIKSPKDFVAAAENPFIDLIYTIKIAREAAILSTDRNTGKFMTSSGSLLTQDELIEYFKSIVNNPELMDIESKVRSWKESV
jgi:hypothetical protein